MPSDRIHELNDTANGKPGDYKRPSVLLSRLSTTVTVGNKSFVQSLPSPLGGLNVTLRSSDNKSATVSVCRFLRTVETGNLCQDGLDNDW